MNRVQSTIRSRLRWWIPCFFIMGTLVFTKACREQPGTEPPSPGGQEEPARTETPPLDELLSAHFKMIEAKRTGPARVRVRQWLDDHPNDARGLFLMGLSYHEDKRYGRALEWFLHATEQEPIYPPAWHFLGWTHFYLGQPDASRLAFEQHLQMNPTEGDSHFALGLLDLEAWQLDEAASHFRKAIELQTDLPHRVKGVSKATARLSEVIEMQTGDADEAIRLLQESVRLYPDHYEAWYRLSQLLQQQGREAEAEAARVDFEASRQRVRPREGGSE